MITYRPRETPEATARRERHRSAAADTAIIETVLRLLEEGATIGELTVEGIIRRNCVGKATSCSSSSSGGAGWPSGTPPCCAMSCCSSRTRPSCGSSTATPVILVRRTPVREVLQRGIGTGEIRGNVDLELLGALIVGQMLSRATLRPGSPLEEGCPNRWSTRCSKECARAGEAGADFGAADIVRPASQNHQQHWRPL